MQNTIKVERKACHVELTCVRPHDEMVATPQDVNAVTFRITAIDPRGARDFSFVYIDEGHIDGIRRRLMSAERGRRISKSVAAALIAALTDKLVNAAHGGALAMDAEDKASSPTLALRMTPDEMQVWADRVRLSQLEKYTTDELRAELAHRGEAVDERCKTAHDAERAAV